MFIWKALLVKKESIISITSRRPMGIILYSQLLCDVFSFIDTSMHNGMQHKAFMLILYDYFQTIQHICFDLFW